MHLVSLLLICLTIFLQNTDVLGKKKIYYVIVHNLTQKVVASDGSLWDDYKNEDWKRWTMHDNGASYFYLKSGLSWLPKKFPYEANSGVTMVLGSEKVCEPSRGAKEDYKRNIPSEQWKVEKGIKPLYNRCEPPLQLTVKEDLLYVEKPEIVNGDPNSLFRVVTENEYSQNK